MGVLEFLFGLLTCWLGFVLIVDRWPTFRALVPIRDAHRLAGGIGFALVAAGVVLQVLGAMNV